MNCNAENERHKRAYFDYLKEAKGRSEASVDIAAKAIHRFESYTRFKSFKAFHIEQAKGFKRHLTQEVNVKTKERLSVATLYSTMAALRAFFIWLAGRPGFKSRIRYSDADYFSLSEKDMRVAKARSEKPVPTPEQIRHVLRSMPTDTEIEMRNRAAVAFIFLTGARDGAVVSMKLKHVNLIEEKVLQDAREVRTKFSKTFTTWFFPVGDDVVEIVREWVDYLIKVKLFGPSDPLFPATRVEVGADQRFQVTGLDRRHWSNATPIRQIFKEAFEAAGLPYFNPHSFRDTLVQLGERLCQTPEEFKGWSQPRSREGHDYLFELWRGLIRAPGPTSQGAAQSEARGGGGVHDG